MFLERCDLKNCFQAREIIGVKALTLYAAYLSSISMSTYGSLSTTMINPGVQTQEQSLSTAYYGSKIP